VPAQSTRRSPLLVGAILAAFLSVGFNVTDDGAQWFWAEVPWTGALLAGLGVVLGVLHFSRRTHAKP